MRQFEYEIWQQRNDNGLEIKTQSKEKRPAFGSDYTISGQEYGHEYPMGYNDYIVAGKELSEDFDYLENSNWNGNEFGEDYTASGIQFVQDDVGNVKENDLNDSDEENEKDREGGVGSFNYKAIYSLVLVK